MEFQCLETWMALRRSGRERNENINIKVSLGKADIFCVCLREWEKVGALCPLLYSHERNPTITERI
jgi:hypothetical protein